MHSVTPHPSTQTSRLASLLCFAGFFLYMAVSAQLLEACGIRYTLDGGHFYEKLHPGTLFVLLSFFTVLWSDGNPIMRILLLWRQHTVFTASLALHCALLGYMILRSGAVGLGFIIDVQISALLCALVLCDAPARHCRAALAFFIALAVLNSSIGLAEAAFQSRLIPFDASWAVTDETYFRASALLGHPLNNALFTSVALFVTLATPYGRGMKLLCAAIFMLSLAAFGGRAALAFSLSGLLLLGMVSLGKWLFHGRHGVMEVLSVGCVLAAMPPLLAAGAYAVSQGAMGERLSHSFYWDESAQSRLLALNAFSYMTGAEILLGIPVERTLDIAYRMSQNVQLASIENPWLLMCMCLGAVAFVPWLGMTLAFLWRLAKGQTFALQLAVLAYFAIASSYNSFGVKSPVYPVMVCAVICASREKQRPV